MSCHPQDSQFPERDVDVRAEIVRLNDVKPRRRLHLQVFPSIYSVAFMVGAVGLAMARISAGSGPADACYGASWDWHLVPFGYDCDFSTLPETGEGAINWSGPPVVFRELDTPAMVTFLLATAILCGALVVHTVMTLIADRRRLGRQAPQ